MNFQRVRLSAVHLVLVVGLVGAAAGVAVARPGPVESLVQLAGNSTEVGGDVSGPCDEPENAHKEKRALGDAAAQVPCR